MTAYYNENDLFAAAWLKELITEKLIAPGEVDTRSICNVAPGDLGGFVQVHFFAGIGGWSHALRLAEWPDDRPVWTGSCPCQPFSTAGKRQGITDPRHLWPEFQRLIAECHPTTVFGEQVAGKDGRLWLTGVRADLEALGYAVGAADLCAAGVAAPHIRQRLYWMADSERDTRDARRLADEPAESNGAPPAGSHAEPRRCSDTGGLGDDDDARLEGRELRNGERADQFTPWEASVFIPCIDGKHRRVPARRMEYAPRDGREQRGEAKSSARSANYGRRKGRLEYAQSEQKGVPGFAWEPRTTEGTWKPEPTIFPLAHGIPNRVGTLRGAGNAIVPQVAAEFIRAAAECLT